MPKTPDQYERMRSKRKRKILNSALKLSVEEGYDNVICDDIAKSAGCSHGLLYHYFENKEAILREIFTEGKKHLEDEFKPIFSNKEDAINILGKLAQKIYEGINSSERYAYFVYLLFVLPISKFKSLKNHEIREKMNADLRAIIVKGQEQNQIISGDPSSLAKCYNNLILGIVFDKIKARDYGETTFDSSVIIELFKKR